MLIKNDVIHGAGMPPSQNSEE